MDHKRGNPTLKPMTAGPDRVAAVSHALGCNLTQRAVRQLQDHETPVRRPLPVTRVGVIRLVRLVAATTSETGPREICRDPAHVDEVTVPYHASSPIPQDYETNTALRDACETTAGGSSRRNRQGRSADSGQGKRNRSPRDVARPRPRWKATVPCHASTTNTRDYETNATP